MEVQGKLVIITGSAQGLGKAFASALLNEGAKVCISDVREDLGNETKVEFEQRFGKENIHFIQCNVTNYQDLTNLYDGCESHFEQKVDIFCNNAGIAPYKPEDWKKVLDIDIVAVFAGTELAWERMSRENGGKGGLIVNTASLAGCLVGFNRVFSSYSAAKWGVVALTRTHGQQSEFSKSGVKVQCICPSFADTAILAPIKGTEHGNEIKSKFGHMTPEYVAEAFIGLIKEGRNGDAVVVVNNTKPFLFPDVSMPFFILCAVYAKTFGKMIGGRVIKVWHQGVFFLFLMFVLHFLLRIFLDPFLF